MRALASLAVAASLTVLVACDDDNTTAVAKGPQAVSYINDDPGLATANPDVTVGSDCAAPDIDDTQRISDPGLANRNVHNDACLFTDGGKLTKLNGAATFESSGVGFISACPDPDNAGAETATLTDANGDGRNDRCVQSGSQVKGIEGDQEYHARLNNNTAAGVQTVVFCMDTNRNGCADETVKKTITVNWTQ